MESLDDRLAKPMEIAQQYAAEVDRDGRFPEETIGALADAGLFGLTIAEDAGGLGGGPSEFLTVTRRIATADPSAAMIYLMHTCAAQVAIAGGAPPATIAAMAAAHLSTLAFSERGSRSHFWAPTSQVQGSNGDARLAATKSFVTSAEHADSYVVSTRPADAASPIESSLFLVEASAAGIETTAPWVGLGLRGNASAPMSFETPLSDTVPLGEGGKGLDLMLGVVLPWFQLGQGAVSLGHRRRRAGCGRDPRDRRPTGAPRSDVGRPADGSGTHRSRPDGGRRGGRLPVRPRASDGGGRRDRSRAVRQGGGQRDGDPSHVRGDAGLWRRRDEPVAADRALLPRRACGLGHGPDHGCPLRAHRPRDGRDAAAGVSTMTDRLMVGAVAYDAEGGPDLGGHPRVLPWRARRDGLRAVLQLRGAGRGAARRADRRRLEHEPRLRAGASRDGRRLPGARDAGYRRRVLHPAGGAARRPGFDRRSARQDAWRSAVRTRRRPRSCPSTTSVARGSCPASTSSCSVSTPTWGNTATLAAASVRPSRRCSMVGPMPRRWGRPAGTRSCARVRCRPAR